MKKFFFAVQIVSLMFVLPVYMIVELNQPIAADVKADEVIKTPGARLIPGVGTALTGATITLTR